MINEIVLAIIQSFSEFLPISSSGHLALYSKIFTTPNLFYFTVLHLASLFAVLFFLKDEIKTLLTFNKESKKMWIYLIVATIPAAMIGFLFNDFVEETFNSFLFLGIAFLLTGFILFSTKFFKNKNRELTLKSSLKIGLMQMFALFPGISRSGITISTGLFQGLNKEKIAKFSFLLFIPLSLGAFLLELIKLENYFFDFSLIIGFLICFSLSFFFLNLLVKIIKANKFWIFSFYCWFMGIISFILHFF